MTATVLVDRQVARDPFDLAADMLIEPPWAPYPWQIPPGEPGAQGMWLISGGRGIGKTDGGSHYVIDHVNGPACDPRLPGGHRIAIIAPTLGDAIESCVDGPSGLKAYDASVRMIQAPGGTYVRWPSGAVGKLFGAYTPEDVERLRAGGNRCLIWAEEIAAWRKLKDAMSHARLGLRIGPRPHFIGTSTPKPRPEYKALLADPRTLQTHGRTKDAHHLAQEVRDELLAEYEGTRLGQQELEGLVLEDIEGALWQQWMLRDDEDSGFQFYVHREHVPMLAAKVLAVDPAVTTSEHADLTAFVVAGRSYGSPTMKDPRPQGYLFSAEQHRMTPAAAMRHAGQIWRREQCGKIVFEGNNGGEYLMTVLEMVDPAAHAASVLIWASKNKRVRATPFATMYEKRLWHHVRGADGKPCTGELEDQQLTWVGTGEEDEKSPDLLDAAVWAAHELFLDADKQPGMARKSDRRLRGRR